MAGSKSDYLENKILDHVLGGGDFARPATVYIALFSAAPSDSGGGTEISTGGYARAAVTNNTTNFPAASGGSKSNGADISFGTVGVGATWSVVAWGIFDAASGGNLLYWGTLTVNKTATDGDPVKILSGQLTISED